MIEDPTRITLVAEEDGEIVGFAMGRTDIGRELTQRCTQGQPEHSARAEVRSETLCGYGLRA